MKKTNFFLIQFMEFPSFFFSSWYEKWPMEYTLKCMDDKQIGKGKFGYVVEKNG